MTATLRRIYNLSGAQEIFGDGGEALLSLLASYIEQPECNFNDAYAKSISPDQRYNLKTLLEYLSVNFASFVASGGAGVGSASSFVPHRPQAWDLSGSKIKKERLSTIGRGKFLGRMTNTGFLVSIDSAESLWRRRLATENAIKHGKVSFRQILRQHCAEEAFKVVDPLISRATLLDKTIG